MRIKFDFVETNHYRLDMEVPESVLIDFCEYEEITMDELEFDPEEYAYLLAMYIQTNYEQAGDKMTYKSGDGQIYNSTLTLD